MSETMRHLLKKLPKKTLIDTIISIYESTFTEPQELKDALHSMALMIQSVEVSLGKSKLEDFQEPFRSEIEGYLKLLHKQRNIKVDKDDS